MEGFPNEKKITNSDKDLFRHHESWIYISKYYKIAVPYLPPSNTPISFVMVKHTVVR